MRLLIGVIVTLFASVWMALSLRQDPAMPCSAWANGPSKPAWPSSPFSW